MIHELAMDLNHHSVDFEIGSLQKKRVRLRGLKRAPCRGIFGKNSIKDGYAFHAGGRKELQFNIGEELRDGEKMIRYGVAFSFQLSQALLTLDPLHSKVLRFNEYVMENFENFPDFLMWHHVENEEHPSTDRSVGPIPNPLFRQGIFIMLGRRVEANEVEFREILAAFDSLLPLYEYVERTEQDRMYSTRLDFTPGRPSFLERTSARQQGGTMDVALRHKTLQMALYDHLCREAGHDNVQVERPLAPGVRVDVAVRRNGQESFYEIKVAPTVRSCVRIALGQLIEYRHWPSANRAKEMVVVGEPELDAESKAYLNLLRQQFDMPLWYRRIDISRNVLDKKS